MTKNEIRVQYSGFIIFTAKILSIATGMIFTLLITRNTTREQFGIWSNISDLTAYFVLFAGVLPFWVTRFVAREKEGSVKTGLVANLAIALISAALYIPLIPIITAALGIGESYVILYLIASAQIINVYLLVTLEACLRATKPQAVGYGLLVMEVFKVTLAYVLIVGYQKHLLGAMIALVVAIAVQIAYYLKLLAPELKQKVQWNYVGEWLKGSTANIYYLAGNQLAAFIFILLFIYGGQAARGDYGAASRIANIITYSFFLSFALYPKMLAENSSKDVTTSLKMVLMFAIPMTAVAMAMPESFLIILDAPYGEAAQVLFLLAIDAFIVTLSQFYTFVVFGVERLDEGARIQLGQLARSNMFKVFTLPYVHALITLPTAFYALTTFAGNHPVQAAVYVTIINMIARFAMFLVLYKIVRKSLTLTVPWKSIAKYVFAAALMAITLYVLPRTTRIITTLAIAAAGGIIYLTLLVVIDKEARIWAYSVWQEAKMRLARKS